MVKPSTRQQKRSSTHFQYRQQVVCVYYSRRVVPKHTTSNGYIIISWHWGRCWHRCTPWRRDSTHPTEELL